MDIELKKIKHSPSLSEESEAFTADLYVNGKRAGYVSNRGNGGPNDYHHYDDAGRELIRQAEAYCKALPPYPLQLLEGKPPEMMEMDLEGFIDGLLNKHLNEKELRRFNTKLEKATINGLVYGIPDDSFQRVFFKLPIAQLIQDGRGRQTLVSTIQKHILPHLTDGRILLNTNLPEDLLKVAGLSETQYKKQEPGAKAQKEKPGLKKGPKR